MRNNIRHAVSHATQDSRHITSNHALLQPYEVLCSLQQGSVYLQQSARAPKPSRYSERQRILFVNARTMPICGFTLLYILLNGIGQLLQVNVRLLKTVGRDPRNRSRKVV
jgi:hypothetical protein